MEKNDMKVIFYVFMAKYFCIVYIVKLTINM